MKITLLYPDLSFSQDHRARGDRYMQPITMGVLARMVPPQDEVIFYDHRLENIEFDEPTDLAAISCLTLTAKSAYEIARRYRSKGVPVVMGGFHPTLMPEEALQNADAICVGRAEGIWPQMVEDARQGRLKKIYQAEGQDYEIASPRRDIYEGKGYRALRPVEFSRGCRFACDFCCVSTFFNRHLTHRPADEVVAEIRSLKKKLVFFTDDNIVADRAKALALFEALAPLNIKWCSQSDISIGNDEQLLDAAARSGCFATLIGFESLDEQNLREMAKSWNVRRKLQYDLVVERIRNKGIMVYGSFIAGYDSDDMQSSSRLLEFVERQKFWLLNYAMLAPYPATRLYKRLKEENRLINDPWWLSDNYRLGDPKFMPVGMTPEELAQQCAKTRKSFYSYRSILKRLFDQGQANSRSLLSIMVFLTSNLAFRKRGRLTYKKSLGASTDFGSLG